MEFIGVITLVIILIASLELCNYNYQLTRGLGPWLLTFGPLGLPAVA